MKKLRIVHRWSIIAAQLPGRTDNDIKNYWNTKLKKKLMAMIPPICQQRFRPQYPSSISSLLQTSSSSSSPSSSPSESYRGSNNSTHCRSAFQGIPFSPTLMTTSCSSSTSDLQLNPQEGLISTQILQHYQVKDQHYQASCSSSDGSCNNNEYGTNRDAVLQQMCHLQQPSNSNCNNNNYYYLCNGVEENQKMIQISQGDCIINNTTSQKQSGNINIINGVWGGGGGGDDQTTTALEYGLEEIKQLISTSSCSNFLFDENKTDQERVVMYY